MLAEFTQYEAATRRRELGAVYTTQLLADWVAEVLDSMTKSRRELVVDPSCGEGALLSALRSKGFSRLGGVDCDRPALKRAERRLPSAEFHHADGLRFLADAARDGGTLAAIVANPPWGATLSLDRPTLAMLGYRVSGGQTDSWDLFVDGILRAAKPGAPVVLILPDALFLPEHRMTRALLARESHITMIARLGEGFFPGVYRGTVVVAARKGKPASNAAVVCARLAPAPRKAVLSGQHSLAAAVADTAHRVLQSRFTADPDCRFDIDSRSQDHVRLALVEERPFAWDQWFEIGRGIELSKSGRIVRCPKCDTAKPVPRAGVATCSSCRYEWNPDESDIEKIVRPNDRASSAGWHPLIVGEDVDRHSCGASRQIRVGINGIRYKPLEVFARPKLLIRKTGLGIKASLDTSGAATNQVVFHFTCRSSAPAMLLDYVAGVLCSRVLLAWHLKRQGEVEWRSHPYITPQVIRRFPIPSPESDDDWAQIAAIASAVRSRRGLNRHDSPEDLKIERLVAGMYGLSEEDMRWVLEVLDSAQQLEPIRTLRLSTAALVSPLHVRRGTV